MTFWGKLIAIALLIATIFSSGMYTEYKFHLAGQVSGLKTEVKNVSEGQNDIIKFNQELEKTNVKKDPCFNTKLPDNVRRLLK